MSTKAIITRLLAVSGVTDLVSDRIQPNIIKQDTLFPAVYVSTDRMDSLGCFTDSGIRMGQVEIGVYGKTYAECHAIIEAIRTALDNYQGTIAGAGLDLQRGKQIADQFDEQDNMHVMVLEYEAITQE